MIMLLHVVSLLIIYLVIGFIMYFSLKDEYDREEIVFTWPLYVPGLLKALYKYWNG